MTFAIILAKVCGFFFDTAIGKAIAAAGIALAVFGGWLWQHDNKVEAKAKTELTQQMNKETETLTHEAVKARAPAQRPGAVDRLRKGSCSDCDG